MAELTLRPDLAERIRDLAQREHRPVDDVIEAMLTRYAPPSVLRTDAEEMEVLRLDRLRMYERARRYWRSVNDERQHLSDEQLEEEFWLFDQDGIPRLKADQNILNLPDDPWLESIAMMEADSSIRWNGPHNSSEHTKEILNSEYPDYLASRQRRSISHTDE